LSELEVRDSATPVAADNSKKTIIANQNNAPRQTAIQRIAVIATTALLAFNGCGDDSNSSGSSAGFEGTWSGTYAGDGPGDDSGRGP